MLTLPVKMMVKQQCMCCIDANSASETDAKQQCIRCIDDNSDSETDGQTTMYALY